MDFSILKYHKILVLELNPNHSTRIGSNALKNQVTSSKPFRCLTFDINDLASKVTTATRD